MTTTKPLRFLHTADWQLGLRVRYIPGDAGAEVRNARLRTVRRIREVVQEQGAEFVIVAGDTFESHGLRPDTVRQALDAMQEFPVPIYLLTGNHDPGTPDSLFQSPIWQRECPPNVRLLVSTEPVQVRDDAWLLPCPVLDRNPLDDPTEHLGPGFGPTSGFRIGVAHGGIREILEGLGEDELESEATISRDTCARGALHYLALGHWHGCHQVDERTWYSGTPEATRFKEKVPGRVLLVELPAPEAPPVVTPIEVQTLRWHKLEMELDDEATLLGLEQRLEAFPDKKDTLLELTLAGTLSPELAARLETEVLPRARDRFRWLRVHDERLHVLLDEHALDDIGREGWIGDVVTALQHDPAPESARALRLLYRLSQEVQP